MAPLREMKITKSDCSRLRFHLFSSSLPVGSLSKPYFFDVAVTTAYSDVKLENMLKLLNKLPRSGELVFQGTNKRAALTSRVKTLARLHNNKRLLKIHFHTFRHCKALREYHKTRDVLHVKAVLVHKSLLTTQIYVEMYTQIYGDIKPERYVSKVAETKEQKLQLINDGWEFVQKDNDGCWYFRKPK